MAVWWSIVLVHLVILQFLAIQSNTNLGVIMNTFVMQLKFIFSVLQIKEITLDNVSGPDSISWRVISADWGLPEKSTFCLLPSMFQSSSLPFLTTSSMYLDSLNQPHNHVHPPFAIHLWVYLLMILVLWLNIAWYRKKSIKGKENISLYFNENSLRNVQL